MIRRRILLGGIAVTLLALTQGCHTSRRAPAHAFSSSEAATRALPVRLRNGPEHDRARAAIGEPYVLEFERAQGGALLYFGAGHTRDPDAPQIGDIRQRWAAFEPTVALCEGRQPRHFWGFLVEPFAGLPEPTLVHALAHRDDVRLVSLEPSYEDEVARLLDRFEAPTVALYFFLRIYVTEASGVADDGLARRRLAERTDVEGLREALPGLEAVDEEWRRIAPDGADWRTLTEEPRTGVLAEISDGSRVVRGEHMARALFDLVSSGERVFAVVGSGHVIRQEWALRAWLGMPPAGDEPAAD